MRFAKHFISSFETLLSSVSKFLILYHIPGNQSFNPFDLKRKWSDCSCMNEVYATKLLETSSAALREKCLSL